METGNIPTLGPTVPVGNSPSLASHWNGGPAGWNFPASTEHHNGFYFSAIVMVSARYQEVLYVLRFNSYVWTESPLPRFQSILGVYVSCSRTQHLRRDKILDLSICSMMLYHHTWYLVHTHKPVPMGFIPPTS